MTGVQGQQPAPSNTAAQSPNPASVLTNHQGGSPRSPPGLQRSLKGILPEPEVQCYAVFASYPGQAWPGGGDASMSIPAKCVTHDAKGIMAWTERFNRALTGYTDTPDASGRKNAAWEPSAANLRSILEEPRDLPTFIYLSGHSDCLEGKRIYLTSDCIVGGEYDSSRVIPYSEIQDKLSLEHHKESVILVTDTCKCENLMELPYVYSYENGKVTCATTEYYTGADWGSADVVHFAATSPDQKATFFSCGSLYNMALRSVPLEKRLSLEETVEHIQLRMDTPLGTGPEKYPAQNHRVYTSRKFDGDDFFGSLGFSLKQRSALPPANGK